MPSYGDRARCKNCGQEIVWSTNEEQAFFWKHDRERTLSDDGLSCRLFAEPEPT
jgi:hypothetical protein